MSHLPRNISPLIFYESIFSELLRIARCTGRLPDFISFANELLLMMIEKGRNRNKISKPIKKILQWNPEILNN